MCLYISHLILASCCNVAACCPSPCPDLAAPDSSIAGEFLDHDTHRGLGGGRGGGGVVSCSAAEQLILTCKVGRGEQGHWRFSVIFSQLLWQSQARSCVSAFCLILPIFVPLSIVLSANCLLKQNGRWAWPLGHLGCS